VAAVSTEIKKGIKRYILTLSHVDLSDLNHECIHLVAMIFVDRDIDIDIKCPSEQEIFGYYHCYWLNRIWETIKNWRS
jgi:hypothetical protein